MDEQIQKDAVINTHDEADNCDRRPHADSEHHVGSGHFAGSCGHGNHAGCGCRENTSTCEEARSCSRHSSEEASSCSSEEASSCSSCDCGHDHSAESKGYEKLCLVLAGVFLATSLVFEHFFANELLALLSAAISIIAGLILVLPETFESLKARSIDINVLLIVAIIGAIYVQAYEEAAAVLFLFSIGEQLEGRALRKSEDAIKELARLAPTTAQVLRNGEALEVPTDQVALNETILLKPGMVAPLDGIITKGASSFNDAAVTGESMPVYKTSGDRVFAASLAVDGSCEFTTTSTVADSTLAKIAEMVRDAQKKKSAREDFVQRFAKVYTPLVIVLATIVAFVPPVLDFAGFAHLDSFNTWIYRACELLVISCPCAFVISTPVTIVSALTCAAKLGILVKGGMFFEEAAKVGAIAFDKTGTLTEGRPEVVEVLTNSSSNRRLLEVAAALEAHSTHPLAQAVVHHVSRKGWVVLSADTIVETAGKGLEGSFEGRRYALGSQDYIADCIGEIVKDTASTPTALETLSTLARQVGARSGTVLYLAELSAPSTVLGALVLTDAVRADAAETIRILKATRQQPRTVMLSGDNERTAQEVAARLGIDEVHAKLLPRDKKERLEHLIQKHRRVAFVGDGINDAPSIALANVGIAMGGAGSDAALTSADVVLMADDIAALPKFLTLSTRVIAVLKQNVVLAIGLKALVALLVVIGVAQMWMAVLADTGVSLLVIANGMRLITPRHS